MPETAVSATAMHQVMSTMTAEQLPLLSSKGTALLPQLIRDHLLHHRCWQTAAIISRDLLPPQVSDHGNVAA